MNINVPLKLVCVSVLYVQVFSLGYSCVNSVSGLQLLDKNSCLFPVLMAMQYPDRC